MTDFEKILAVFEIVFDYYQFGIKKTFKDTQLVALELNNSGNYWKFNPTNYSLIEVGRY